VIWFLPTKVPLIAIAVTDYDYSRAPLVPPNAWAHEDLQRFEQLSQVRVSNKEREWGAAEEAKKYLSMQLEKARKGGGPARNVVIIYLSAHGVLDRSGHPCLLLAKSDPLDAKTWLPMSEVLQVLGESKADRKLLVLDCAQVPENWGLGQLCNGF